MNIPDKFVYLIALIPFCLIWALLFIKRKDLRKEIIFISIFIGILSVLTSYFWWTKDWWRPLTITGTRVGFEDFIMGFTTGGIMSIIYDFIFKKRYQKVNLKHNLIKAFFILLFMTCFTAWLIIIGLTSFWSSTISMFLFVIFMIFMRRDLFFNSLISGIAMMFISIFFYLTIILISKIWISNTYLYGLSGLKILTIPIEEFVFWFLAGMWVGPFYEFAFNKKLEDIKDNTKK